MNSIKLKGFYNETGYKIYSVTKQGEIIDEVLNVVPLELTTEPIEKHCTNEGRRLARRLNTEFVGAEYKEVL